jgi:hypothetical protein
MNIHPIKRQHIIFLFQLLTFHGYKYPPWALCSTVLRGGFNFINDPGGLFPPPRVEQGWRRLNHPGLMDPGGLGQLCVEPGQCYGHTQTSTSLHSLFCVLLTDHIHFRLKPSISLRTSICVLAPWIWCLTNILFLKSSPFIFSSFFSLLSIVSFLCSACFRSSSKTIFLISISNTSILRTYAYLKKFYLTISQNSTK